MTGLWDSQTGPILIGMVHLAALPGAARFAGDLQSIRDAALRDARALVEGGAHGLIVENFGDAPFYPGQVPPEVVANMSAIIDGVRREVGPTFPIGVNVLRNDGLAGLAIAQATGASFIRVNVLCGARVTDQGIIQGIAQDLLRRRKEIGAESVKIFADVDVKHSAPLAPRPLEDEVADTLHRGLADALIVSGSGTGRPTDASDAKRVHHAANSVPLFIGSGVTAETIQDFRSFARGFIVGTSLKENGAVSERRVREFLARL